MGNADLSLARSLQTVLSKILRVHGGVITFLALFFFSALAFPDVFLKPENLRNLLSQNAPIGI
ncbi:MAG: hypothetical protein QXI19_00750, partial [Candidatus Caldarchaeum sp.]